MEDRGCKVSFDYKLVAAKLRVKLNALQKPATNIKYDVDLLEIEEAQAQYKTTRGSKFAILAERKGIDCEQIRCNLQSTVNETAKELAKEVGRAT